MKFFSRICQKYFFIVIGLLLSTTFSYGMRKDLCVLVFIKYGVQWLNSVVIYARISNIIMTKTLERFCEIPFA